jgi:hypothetical protein
MSTLSEKIMQFGSKSGISNLKFYSQGKGSLSDIDLHIFAINRQDGKKIANFSGKLLFDEKAEINGELSLFENDSLLVKSKIESIFNNENIKVKYKSEGFAELNLHLDLEDSSLTAEAEFEKIKLNRWDYLIIGKNLFTSGDLKGDVKLWGKMNKLKISADLEFDNAIANNVGLYSGSVDFISEENKFLLNNFEIKHNDKRIFYASGSYNNKLNFSFGGADINTEALLKTLNIKNKIIKGNATLSAILSGSLDNPKFEGELRIGSGSIASINFDALQLSFFDTLLDVNSKSMLPQSTIVPEAIIQNQQHKLRIQNFSIRRGNRYQVTGSGYIPYNTNEQMDILLAGQGDFLSIFSEIDPFFQEAKGSTLFRFNLKGSLKQPYVSSASIKLSDGYLKLASVIKEIKNIDAEIKVETQAKFHTAISLSDNNIPMNTLVNIERISGEIKSKKFKLYTVPQAVNSNRRLDTWKFLNNTLDFGVFVIETEEGGIPVHIPGLLEPNDEIFIETYGKTENEKFYLAGPVERPVIRGKLLLRNGKIWYPFLHVESSSNKKSAFTKFLENIEWDIKAVPANDNRYLSVFQGYIGNVELDINIDDKVGEMDFKGAITDKTFKILGKLQSTNGTLNYLDLNFRVEKVMLEFDGTDQPPIISGRAYTVIRDRSGNFPRDIYLKLYAVDKTTKQEVEQGRLTDIKFKLSSTDPQLNTQERILESLGYSVQNIASRASTLGGIVTENLLARALVRPIERQLEKTLKLDVVRLSPSIAKNVFNQDSLTTPVVKPGYNVLDQRLVFLSGSKVTVGKYLSDFLFLSYTSQLVSGYNIIEQKEGIGLNHKLNLEYRITPGLFLNFEYDYDKLRIYRHTDINSPNDFRIQLRHSFSF